MLGRLECLFVRILTVFDCFCFILVVLENFNSVAQWINGYTLKRIYMYLLNIGLWRHCLTLLIFFLCVGSETCLSCKAAGVFHTLYFINKTSTVFSAVTSTHTTIHLFMIFIINFMIKNDYYYYCYYYYYLFCFGHDVNKKDYRLYVQTDWISFRQS